MRDDSKARLKYVRISVFNFAYFFDIFIFLRLASLRAHMTNCLLSSVST